MANYYRERSKRPEVVARRKENARLRRQRRKMALPKPPKIKKDRLDVDKNVWRRAIVMRSRYKTQEKRVPMPDIYLCLDCKRLAPCWTHRIDSFCKWCGSARLKLLLKSGLERREFELAMYGFRKPESDTKNLLRSLRYRHGKVHIVYRGDRDWTVYKERSIDGYEGREVLLSSYGEEKDRIPDLVRWLCELSRVTVERG